MINRQWRLAARPNGELSKAHFQWVEEPVAELQPGQIRVRNQLLSLDPTNRLWVNEQDSYLPAVPLGEVMRGVAIGVVEESRCEGVKEGERVTGLLGWQDYAVLPGELATVVPDIPGIPLEAHHALLGATGMTAYFGLLDIGQPQPDETLVVSGAAGAVGSLVCQMGKIHNLRVVGIAGGADKCAYLKDELGCDAVVDYKAGDVDGALRAACPVGIDIYFDNVGGEILDAVLGQIKDFARIIECGLISQYNTGDDAPGPRNYKNILIRRAKVQGFIVMDYLHRAEEAMADIGSWFMEGKLRYRADVREGLEHAPEVLNELFRGANNGKLMLKIQD